MSFIPKRIKRAVTLISATAFLYIYECLFFHADRAVILACLFIFIFHPAEYDVVTIVSVSEASVYPADGSSRSSGLG